MADILTYWRTTNRITARCQALKVGDTHPCADHIGDLVTILPASRISTISDEDRRDFALLLITDIPDESLAKVEELLRECTMTDGVDSVVDRPRTRCVDPTLLKTVYPSKTTEIDDSFDPTQIVPINNVPTVTWDNFCTTIWDKINSRVTPVEDWVPRV